MVIKIYAEKVFRSLYLLGMHITMMFTYLLLKLKITLHANFCVFNVFQYLFSGILFKNNPPIGQQIVETSPQCAEQFERTICASYTRKNAAVVFTLLYLCYNSHNGATFTVTHSIYIITQVKWNEMATCRFRKDDDIWETHAHNFCSLCFLRQGQYETAKIF